MSDQYVVGRLAFRKGEPYREKASVGWQEGWAEEEAQAHQQRQTPPSK